MTFVLVVVETYVVFVRTLGETLEFFRGSGFGSLLYFIQLKIKHLQADMSSRP
jgi:hypothetical protein